MFEVVKLKSFYYALFGRSVYVRFMVRLCYIYFKFKMSGFKGFITMDGDRRIVKECEEGDAVYAEVVCAAEEFKYYRVNVDPADMLPLKKLTTDAESFFKFKLTDDIKTVDFVSGDLFKQFIIGTGLDFKQESAFIEFIRENRDIYVWKFSDMFGVSREFAEYYFNVDSKCKFIQQYFRRFNKE